MDRIFPSWPPTDSRQIVDCEESSPKQVFSGNPQATVLGPLLFLKYINTISNSLYPRTITSLFADDSRLYRIIKSD